MERSSNFALIAAAAFFLTAGLTNSAYAGAPSPSTANNTIDDYAPGWVWSGMTEYDDPGLYGGRAHAGGAGGYGSFTFTGTGVEVYGVTAPTVQVDGRVHRVGALRLSIDGKPLSTESARRSTTDYNAGIGQVTGLAPGIHVLEVAPEDGWVIVDYIKVIDDTHALPADPARGSSHIPPGALGTPVYMMNVGGPAVGDWQADSGAYGGTVASSTDDIYVAGVTDPAPTSVYQSERWGPCGFLVPNLTPGGSYNVRLDFAETFYTRPLMRRFDVAINGETVLNDFDLFSAAGGKDRAFSIALHATADAQGRIAIAFLKGRADNPVICGISVYKP